MKANSPIIAVKSVMNRADLKKQTISISIGSLSRYFSYFTTKSKLIQLPKKIREKLRKKITSLPDRIYAKLKKIKFKLIINLYEIEQKQLGEVPIAAIFSRNKSIFKIYRSDIDRNSISLDLCICNRGKNLRSPRAIASVKLAFKYRETCTAVPYSILPIFAVTKQ